MADLKRLESALRKADAAGNVEDARRLAAAIRAARQQQAPMQTEAERQHLDRTMSYGPNHPRLQEADARQKVMDYATFGVPQGVLWGGADEAAAAVRSLGPETYGDALTGIRSKQDMVRERSPGAVKAGELTGAAISSVVPMAGTIHAARGLGTGGQMVASGLMGGGITAAQGFLEGEGGFGPRMENAMQPGPLAAGVGTGAAAPVVGRLIGGGMRGARDLYGATANPALRGLGYDRVAAREISRAFRRDQNFLQDARAYLTGLGPEGQLADLGTNTRQTARAIAGMPGEAGQQVALAATQRQGGRVNRVLDDMDEALGIRESALSRNDDLALARRQAARQAYDQFNAQEFPLTDELRDAIRRADDAGALTNARRIAAAEGHDIDPGTYLAPGTVAINGRALDAISRSLRDSADAAWRQGNGQLGQALSDLNDQFISRAPQLRAIRRQYASDSDLIRANEAGNEILRSRESHEAFRRRWENMSPDAQNEFRIGARDALDNEIDAAVRADTKSLSMFGPTNTMAKVRTVFGPEAARVLERRVAAERVMAGTDNRIRGGSDTAATREFQDAMAPYRQTSQNWLPMRPIHGLNYVGNRAVDSVIRRNPEVVTRDIARALTAQGPERDRLVQGLLADAMRAQTNATAYRGLENAISRGLLAAPGAAGVAAR